MTQRTTDSPMTFDRWDFLGTRVLLGAVALGTLVASIVVPLVDTVRGRPLTRLVDTGRTHSLGSPDVTPREGVRLAWPGTAEATVPEPSLGLSLATLLPGVVIATAVLLVVGALWRLLQRIETGAPFARESVRSLRLVAVVVMVGSIAHVVAAAVVNTEVLAAATERTGTTVFTLHLGPTLILMASGLMVAAVAEAFAHGVRLADDVEGLV